MMNKENILVLRYGYYPEDPRLKKQISALLEKNFKVQLICLKMKKGPYLEKLDNLKVYRLSLMRKRGSLVRYFFEYSIAFTLYFLIVNILFLLKRHKYIVVHTLPDYLTFVTLLPKLFGAKIITDFHEPTPELVMAKFGADEKNFLVKVTKKLEQSVIKYSDAAITVTPSLKNRYVQRGADANKVIVVSNVCEEDFFGKKKNITGKKENFVIVTHGAIEERYGHETVIRAVNLLKERYPNIKYRITGAGSYIPALQNLINELLCGNNVEILGHLSFNDLVETLVSADVGVVPMLRNPYSELIDTNKMYEYIDMKLPVIVSRLQPVEDNFDESCVSFFEPGDFAGLSQVIEKLYLDPQLRTEISVNAYKKYEMLKWNRVKQDFLKLFSNGSVTSN